MRELPADEKIFLEELAVDVKEVERLIEESPAWLRPWPSPSLLRMRALEPEKADT